ncbi:MAG: sugar phosphate isomerase [Planctomycetaceae bacterium]|nr:sugar phosphate isomerase [Planctomycetaceae bacterium]
MNQTVDRRTFLKTAAVAGGALALAPESLLADKADPYAGFKMGIQSYSLRGFTVEEALKHSEKLGLNYWEAYPRHLPMSAVPKDIANHKELLKGSNIKLLAYGVLGFDENESKARAAFDFAKAMGIVSLSANPKKTKGTFDLLDKLCDEYKVAIAIHNHGPRALYDKISDVEEMVKDRHPLVGACVDTGHFLRSGEVPAEAIERLGKRVFGVHLKDVKTIDRDGKKQRLFKILGEGDLNVPACLKVLKKLKYQNVLSLEYEENPSNPLSDIEACLAHVRESAKTLRG